MSTRPTPARRAWLATVRWDSTTAGVGDSVLVANYMYASGLGALQLARIGMLVKESSPGIPTISRISGDQVRDFLTTTAVALAAGA